MWSDWARAAVIRVPTQNLTGAYRARHSIPLAPLAHGSHAIDLVSNGDLCHARPRRADSILLEPSPLSPSRTPPIRCDWLAPEMGPSAPADVDVHRYSYGKIATGDLA
jgi:hypothetical protein